MDAKKLRAAVSWGLMMITRIESAAATMPIASTLAVEHLYLLCEAGIDKWERMLAPEKTKPELLSYAKEIFRWHPRTTNTGGALHVNECVCVADSQLHALQGLLDTIKARIDDLQENPTQPLEVMPPFPFGPMGGFNG